MNSSLDLTIIPLVHPHTLEIGVTPGVHGASAPRWPGRGRAGDRLLLYLAFAEGGALPPGESDRLLARLARTYFKTSGTVTSAQRAVAEVLNQHLLELNAKDLSSRKRLVGLLSQVVLRGNRLCLALSGPIYAFVMAGLDVHQQYEPALSSRGLGLTRSASINYFQTQWNPNDAVLLTQDPHPAWTKKNLHYAHSQGLESLRRYLVSQGISASGAVLVETQQGKGELRLLQPLSSARRMPASLQHEATHPAQELEEAGDALSEDAFPIESGMPKDSDVGATFAEESYPPPPTPFSPRLQRQSSAMGQAAAAGVSPEPSRKIGPPPRDAILKPLRSAVVFILGGLGRLMRGVGRGSLALFKAMLPDAGIFTLPASTMAAIAIVIPILVVAVSSLVYFQRGRVIQFETRFAQALEAASIAREQTEPQLQRMAWRGAVQYLDDAETYLATDDSRELRAQAQGILDQLDYVERLDFRPALATRLKDTDHISRMVATDTDLYLLNAKEGLVLRATLGGGGYVLDPTFQCGPGLYAGQIVGAIIDIAPLPRGIEGRATLAGIDANGNLLFCIPGEPSLARPMAPPEINWGNPMGISIDAEDLYVLDPQTNAVWIYRGMNTASPPRLFFAQQVPPMQGVIDLAVNRNDMYLLHTDSHITICTFSALAESPTRCEDPAHYTDPRPGMQNGPVVQSAHFTEILFSPPPDPSIYLLEANSRAVYHFSVRLTFQRQFQSSAPLPPGPATAFAISQSNRSVIIAIGNEVFQADLP